MRLNFRKTTYKQWAKQWHSDTFNKSEVDRERESEREQKRRSISFWCCCYFIQSNKIAYMRCDRMYVRTQLNACVCNISNITAISEHSVFNCCCCCHYWPDRITSDLFCRLEDQLVPTIAPASFLPAFLWSVCTITCVYCKYYVALCLTKLCCNTVGTEQMSR